MKVTSTAIVGSNVNVPLDNIIPHKEVYYRPTDSAAVTELMEDIKLRGLLQPIITFAPSEDAKVRIGGKGEAVPCHYLAAGQHRRLAIQQLRKTDKETFEKLFKNGVPVRHFIGNVQDMMFAMLRENLKRREMSAAEIFPVLEKLSNEHKLSGKEIAQHIGKSTAWVSLHMDVNKELDEDTKEDVVSGKIDVGDARKLAQEVKKDRKSGKEVTKEKIREKATELKAKKSAKVSAGTERASGDDRKVGTKKIWQRLQALRKLPNTRLLEVYQGAFAYIVGEANKLPAELRKDVEAEKSDKPAKKADKPAKK